MKCGPSGIFSKRRCFCAAGEAGQAFEIWGTLEQTHSLLIEGTEEAGGGAVSERMKQVAPAGCGAITRFLGL